MLRYLQNRMLYGPRKEYLEISETNTPMFDSVFFEVRTRCNGTCPFCAASVQNETREDTSMPTALYRKAVKELGGLNFAGRVAYHVNSDPLIFPRLPEFVKYARAMLPDAWLQILTNGKALTVGKAEELIKAGINELSINHYSDDLSAELPDVFKQIKDGLLPRLFRPEQVGEGCYEYHAKHDMGVFKFNVFRRRLTATLTTRAGTSPNKGAKSSMPRGFCELPFTQFNITTDGRVGKCGSDHFFSGVMGNLNEQGMMEIWEGKRFADVRSRLLDGDRDAIKGCRECDFFGCQDMHLGIYSRFSRVLYYVLNR